MSVTLAEGFVASGLAAGIKSEGRRDVSLLATDDGKPVPAAAVFTQNKFRAPPVDASLERLNVSGGHASGVIVNSGNANAGTGDKGRADAEAMCAAAADAVGCDPRDMLVCSTGLIGFRLPMRKILTAIPRLGETLSRDGHRDAAKGILTTDTRPKEAEVVRDDYSVGGMAKGCGMLAPNMATMLAFLTTDAELTPEELKPILFRAADATFNELITDGATSTNDTVMLFASGRKGRPADLDRFEDDVRRGVRGIDAADGARCGRHDQAGRHSRHRRGQRRRSAESRPIDRQQPIDQVQLVRRRRLLGPAARRGRVVRCRVRSRNLGGELRRDHGR